MASILRQRNLDWSDPYICLDKIHGKVIGSFTLNTKQMALLEYAILAFLEPSKTVLEIPSSHGLKHCFEKLLGFYISNSDMKLAMTKVGYVGDDRFGNNWCFRIKKTSPIFKISNVNLQKFGSFLAENHDLIYESKKEKESNE